jgi:hypothetical protein
MISADAHHLREKLGGIHLVLNDHYSFLTLLHAISRG